MSKSAELKRYLQKAIDGKFAIAAINTTNMETTQAAVEAAKELNSPLIIQITESAIKYAGFEYAEAILKIASEVPQVFINLDHGMTIEMAKRCGNSDTFSAVMIDKSKYKFEDNLEVAKELKNYLIDKLVEAELGVVGGKEEDIIAEGSIYTNPEDAEEFVRRSGVDLLAIAIGTAHGVYKDTPILNYNIIKEIREKLPRTPLVLHGSSGLTDKQLKMTIEVGINKVNLDTEIKQEFIKGFQNYLKENPSDYDLRKIFGTARSTAKELIKDKIRILGSENTFESIKIISE